jgi:hypothetical protein
VAKKKRIKSKPKLLVAKMLLEIRSLHLLMFTNKYILNTINREHFYTGLTCYLRSVLTVYFYVSRTKDELIHLHQTSLITANGQKNLLISN